MSLLSYGDFIRKNLLKMKKTLQTVKNISWGTLYVRNSDWKKTDVSNNWTFVTYKSKELLRLYWKYFTVVSDENPDTPVYKITAVSESIVSIVDKKWAEIISMKVETDDKDVSTFYLWIGWTRKADDDADTIALVEEMIESVIAWDNIVEKSDADTLIAEYESLSD